MSTLWRRMIAVTQQLWRRVLPSQQVLAEIEALPVEQLQVPSSEHPEIVPVGPPEVRKQEVEWLRTYDRELRARLEALAIDSDILGRRVPQVRRVGQE